MARHAHLIIVLLLLVYLVIVPAPNWRRRRRRRCPPPPPPPPNRKPDFTYCPSNLGEQFIDTKFTDTRTVTWTLPTAKDDYDGTDVSIVGATTAARAGPGSSFSTGKHDVKYCAKDNQGLQNCNCEFNFVVKVRTCSSLATPTNGYISCSHAHDYGSTCSFICEQGYYISSTATRECSRSTTMYWSGQSPTCTRRTCLPMLSNPQHGSVSCSAGNLQSSVCTHSCVKSGYTLSDNTIALVTCKGPTDTSTAIYGTWSSDQPTCIDTEKPTYTSCPDQVVAYSDEGKTSTTVTWDVQISDNSGETITPILVEGQNSGSVFDRGYHTIRYRATDSAGNVNDCAFSVLIKVITCLSLPSIPNLSVKCSSEFIYGSECNFVCVDGYDLNGDTSTECILNGGNPPTGVWTKQPPLCEPVECPLLNPPTNGNFLDGTECANTFPSTCYFECNIGYELIGSNAVQCTPLRTWDEPIPECRIKTCPKPHLFNGMIIDCPLANPQVPYGGECKFNCTAGFYLEGDSSIKCGPDGVWLTPVPSCNVITCDSLNLPKPLNGQRSCSGILEYGHTCTLSCNHGFLPDISIERNCTDDGMGIGVWDGGTITCNIVKCDPLPTPLHGQTVHCAFEGGSMDVEEQQSYSSACTAECNVGYTGNGSYTRSCLATGHWDGTTLECYDVTPPALSCPDDTTNYTEYGQITLNYPWPDWEPVLATDAGVEFPSELLEFNHVNGSKPSQITEGVHTITYKATDNVGLSTTCSFQLTVKVTRCPGVYAPYNGSVSFLSGHGSCEVSVTFGSQCVFKCDTGYHLTTNQPSEVLTCQRDTNPTPTGFWDKTIPTCTPNTCVLPSVNNGYIVGCENEVDYTTTCQFRCNLGYTTPTGVLSVDGTCQADETFGLDFQCDVDVVCQGPLSVDHGTVYPSECGNLTSLPYDTLCQLSCNDGYNQSGAYTRRCTETGTWHDTSATICQDIESPRFQHTCPIYLTFQATNGTSVTGVTYDEPVAIDNSGYVTLSRQTGHKGNGDIFEEGTTTVTYIAIDADGNSAQCNVRITIEVFRCSPLQAPLSGNVQCSDYVKGSICDLSCNVGYRLVGSSLRTCLRDEYTGDTYWSGSEGVCQIVTCPAVETPQNAIKSGCLADPPETEDYGTICTFYCDHGYEASGYVQSQCQADGTWTTVNFNCTEKECPVLNTPKNMASSPSTCTTTPTFGDICTLSCMQSGYVVMPIGSRTLTCMATGLWSMNPGNLTCVDKESPTFSFCPDYITAYADKSSNATIVFANVTAVDNDGSEPTVECDEPVTTGVTMSGENSIKCIATDLTGNQNTCAFQVAIIVRRCLAVPVPAYGSLVGACDDSYGSSCAVECQSGYRLTGSSIMTCEYDGTLMYWYVDQEPLCQVIDCDPLVIPDIVDVWPPGCLGPGKPQRGTTCSFSCPNSFSLIGNDTSTITCQNDGLWSRDNVINDLACIDEIPPYITSCPAPIYATLIDVAGVEVTFNDPTATDNSGQTPIISKTPLNITSPYTATYDTTIVYTFCDDANNCANCSFVVYVQDDLEPVVVFCPPNITTLTSTQQTLVSWDMPIFEDPRGGDLDITDPYCGEAEAKLLIGTHTITYTAVKTENGKLVSCTFYIEIKVQPCPILPAPRYGALVCNDLSSGGEFCTIFCQDGYDIPRTYRSDVPDIYVCPLSGVWSYDIVPDCAEREDPRRTYLPSTLMYYTNACTNVSTNQYLADTFLQLLGASPYSSVCSTEDKCSIGNVVVTCGPVGTTRRKRAVRPRMYKDGRQRRQAMEWEYQLEVEFWLEIEVHNINGDSFDDVLDAEYKMLDMIDIIQEQIDDGGFQLPAVDGVQFEILQDSLEAGYAELLCDEGFTANNDDYVCVACTTGTRYVNDTKLCELCGVGYYQVSQAQSECIPCPEGTTTLRNGSTNITDCIPLCQPGSYSDTGVESCQQCPAGYYQSDPGQRSCLQCPNETSTAGPGSNASSECREYCFPGTFSSDGLLPCELCPRRYYQHAKGKRQCILCPGTNTTMGEASTSLDECFDINECDSSPCMNGGNCHNMIDSYSCLCMDGYTGTNCEINIDDCQSMPCENDGTCYDDIANFTCSCLSGYSGRTCNIDINECESSPCQHGGICEDLINAYKCKCIQWFEGTHCETEIDFCDLNPCMNGATCENNINSYECLCVAGFTGPNCQTNINECTHIPCQNEGTCTDGINSYSCQCTKGYTGSDCNVKINLCENNPCFNNASCIDLGNTVSCTCHVDKTGSLCENDIIDVMECENGGTSFMTLNGPQCVCPEGFVGQYCEINFDECGSGPCSNDGSCVDGVASYQCLCIDGFQGQNCEENIDECGSNPCADGSTCMDHTNYYSCKCQEGFTGSHCDGIIDPCEQYPCQQNSTCNSYTNGSYWCECLPGYTGFDCSSDVDECLFHQCENGAECIDGVNQYTCVCLPGYEGSYCQIDVDECQNTPCGNGGVCEDGVNTYTCTCKTGYTGDTCDEEIDFCSTVPCLNGATCGGFLGGYLCMCIPGYTGLNCGTDIDDCTSNPCINAVRCNDEVNNYNCECQTDWSGKNCDEFIPPCSSSPCQNNGVCVDLFGPYICLCQPGFTGSNCETNIDDCANNNCQNNATCVDGINRYTCQCLPAFSGRTCHIVKDDLCSPNPCLNGGLCSNSLGAYTCSCLDGFEGTQCELEVDECNSNNCQNGASCIDQLNKYVCRCVPGYTGQYCEFDIDECSSSPCQNGGTCNDLVNGYNCSCHTGFDGLLCEANRDDCFPNPCENSGLCEDGVNDFTCICSVGFSGRTCSENVNDCVALFCGNGATCVDGVDMYSCSCAPGYVGLHCEIAQLMDYDFLFLNTSLSTDFVSANIEGLGTMQSITLAFWLRVSHDTGSFTLLLEHVTPDNIVIVAVKVTETSIIVDLNGTESQAPVAVADGKWHHIAVIWESSSGKLVVYQDNSRVYNELNVTSSSELPVDGRFSIRFQNNGHLEGAISSLNYWNEKMSEATMAEISTACDTEHPGNLVAWSDFINGGSGTGVVLQSPSSCDDFDECSSSPCQNSGTCVDLVNEFQCICTDKYTGSNCESEIDFCEGNICQNGASCEVHSTSYTCYCQPGFKGEFCDIKILNGGWDVWSDWSICTKSCEGGTQYRTRHCNDPPPLNGGLDCVGNNNETRPCNTEDCPGCRRLRRPHRGYLHCNETEEEINCKVSCNAGYAFSERPLDLYFCGPSTGWLWNHETSDNPMARVPPCSKTKPPTGITISLGMPYPTLPCTTQEENKIISDTAMDELKDASDNVTCLKESACNITSVKVHSCDAQTQANSLIGRRRRQAYVQSNEAYIEVLMNLRIDDDMEDDLIVQNNHTNSTLSRKKRSADVGYEDAVAVMDRSAEDFYATIQVLAKEGKMKITIGDITADPDPSNPISDGWEDCPVGYIEYGDGICVRCGLGTYLTWPSGWPDPTCWPCPVNFYQDEEGQYDCIQCPEGMLTQGIGSSNLTDCYVPPTEIPGTTEPLHELLPDEETDVRKVIAAATVSVCAIGVVVFIVVYVIRWKSRTKKVSAVDKAETDSIENIEITKDAVYRPKSASAISAFGVDMELEESEFGRKITEDVKNMLID